jgi:hypothetical protein
MYKKTIDAVTVLLYILIGKENEMAVLNPMHLSEGKRVTIVRKDGVKVRDRLMLNNLESRVLCLELEDGFYDQVGYEEFERATVSIRLPRYRSVGRDVHLRFVTIPENEE